MLDEVGAPFESGPREQQRDGLGSPEERAAITLKTAGGMGISQR